MELRIDFVSYIHERAKSLQMVLRNEEAIDDFTKVIQLQPMNSHAYFRRAFSFKALQRFDEAASDFEKAKSLDPNNPRLVVNYKRIFLTDVIQLVKAGEGP